MKDRAMVIRLLVSILGAALAIATATGSAAGKVPAANGMIAFDRNEGEAIFTVSPDGSGERQVLPWSTCCPRWSPDGRKLSIPRLSDDGRILGAIVNADGTGYTPIPQDDPTLNGGGGVWAPDGSHAAGEY